MSAATATCTKREKQQTEKHHAAAKDAYVQSVTGIKLAGEVITWEPGKGEILFTTVVQALADCGLDSDVAKELLPRHAFSRACKMLADERIIQKFKEEGDLLYFQFTKVFMEKAQFDYRFETMLKLNKVSGAIECSIKELAAKASGELALCIAARTPSDVTAIVQRLFERQDRDVFPIRRQGGAYFVFAEHADFVGRIQRFLEKLGGSVGRLPVAAGTKEGGKTIKDVVKAGIEGMIADHLAAIEHFGLDTREDTLQRAAERIKLTRLKVDVYQCYLADQAEHLGKALEEATARLKNRVECLARAKQSDCVTECDFCHAPNPTEYGAPDCTCGACGQRFKVEWAEEEAEEAATN
jgi:hypothetical protein